ncbi:MAG: hypothetical protein IT170_13520 [Bryobacterales bacterium]|nr:hypothetical protein [Bryobacterales bacterium]
MNRRLHLSLCHACLLAATALVAIAAWPLAAQEKKADSATVTQAELATVSETQP